MIIHIGQRAGISWVKSLEQVMVPVHKSQVLDEISGKHLMIEPFPSGL
jgi:hypothetical protein